MKLRIAELLVVALMAAACSAEKISSPVQYGEISVTLSDEPTVEVVTKTDESSTEFSDYQISIYDNQSLSGDPVYGPVAYGDFQTQKLAFGTYYVTAENCAEAAAEGEDNQSGQMRLYGCQSVEISEINLIQEVEVLCEVSNALVTIGFDESIFENGQCRVNDLQVRVYTESKSFLVSASQSATSVWFNPGSLEYEITGTYEPTGKDIEIEGSLTLAAKSNIQLNVKLNLSNGLIGDPTIDVDTTVSSVIEDGQFNPYNTEN